MTTIYAGNCLEVLRGMPDESVHCCMTSPPYWGVRYNSDMDGALGEEATFSEHLEHLLEAFREVRRVLRKDGILWLNYGNPYWSAGRPNEFGWKAKDLTGTSWLVSSALMQDGWYRRSSIIWEKPHPIPEPMMSDRPGCSYQDVFLMTRSPRYFYDPIAVRIPSKVNPDKMVSLRNVWTIAQQPLSGVTHFATFPPALVERCIKASTSEEGVCEGCGAPRKREIEKTLVGGARMGPKKSITDRAVAGVLARDRGSNIWANSNMVPGASYQVETLGWSDTCECGAETIPATVLDPFGGAGTVGLVARELGRDSILIEIEPDHAEAARARIGGEAVVVEW